MKAHQKGPDRAGNGQAAPADGTHRAESIQVVRPKSATNFAGEEPVRPRQSVWPD